MISRMKRVSENAREKKINAIERLSDVWSTTQKLLFMLSKQNFLRIAFYWRRFLFLSLLSLSLLLQQHKMISFGTIWNFISPDTEIHTKTIQRFYLTSYRTTASSETTDWLTKKMLPLWWTNKHVHLHNQKNFRNKINIVESR